MAIASYAVSWVLDDNHKNLMLEDFSHPVAKYITYDS